MTSYTIHHDSHDDEVDYNIETNEVWLNGYYLGYTYAYDEQFGGTKWAIARADGCRLDGFNTHIKAHNWLIKNPPIEEPETDSPKTNELTAACQKYGFGLDVEGNVYQGEEWLGQVGYDGDWWVIRQSSEHGEAIPCDSAEQAVWSLWMTEAS